MRPTAEGDVSAAAPEAGDASAAPEQNDAGLRRYLGQVGLPQTVLAAFVAWSVTVAPAAFARSAPGGGLAVALAILALLVGIGGPLLLPVRPRLSRHIGISLFLALAVLTWLIASPAVQPSRLDPLRAGIGAVAWGVFALSWNERWTFKVVAPHDPDPQAPALPARAMLPGFAVPIAGVGVVGALAYIALAWRVRDADRALMAHAVALICAVALVTSAATVATARGKRRVGGVGGAGGSGRLTSQAVRSLVLLVAAAVAGALVIALR